MLTASLKSGHHIQVFAEMLQWMCALYEVTLRLSCNKEQNVDTTWQRDGRKLAQLRAGAGAAETSWTLGGAEVSWGDKAQASAPSGWWQVGPLRSVI